VFWELRGCSVVRRFFAREAHPSSTTRVADPAGPSLLGQRSRERRGRRHYLASHGRNQDPRTRAEPRTIWPRGSTQNPRPGCQKSDNEGCLLQHIHKGVRVVREAAQEKAVNALTQAAQQTAASGAPWMTTLPARAGSCSNGSTQGHLYGGDVLVGRGIGGADRPPARTRRCDVGGRGSTCRALILRSPRIRPPPPPHRR
jgi:hypothetical protein